MKEIEIITSDDLKQFEKRKRTNLINGLSGLRSANLIATLSETGNENLAIFNSVMHIGADPALMGFIMRPEVVERQTMQNIRYNKKFTINQVTEAIHKQSHLTSAKFDKETSEFEACQISPYFHQDYPIPFVKESNIKIALNLEEEILVKSNNTILVIGKVDFILLNNGILDEAGHIDFEQISGIAVNGLDTYYTAKKIAKYKFARPNMTIKDI